MYFGIYRDFIFQLVRCTGASSYLELGVSTGDMISSINDLGINIIGVDVNDNRIKKVGLFYKMTTDEFFKIFNDKVDIIFIDACHKIDFVLNDLKNSVNHLNENGIIILHDTDPKHKDLINSNGDWCGDAVKINFIEINDLSMVTLPIGDEGLTIIRRRKETRVKNENIDS
jgi:predicted O-methyltransferase YrrM